MSTISLRVSNDELRVLRAYAKINNSSLSDIIRSTMMRSIEDEYDLQVFNEYESEKAHHAVKTYSHDEAWKELGL